MLSTGIGTCTCRYFWLQYLILEVSVKIGIGTALTFDMMHRYSWSLYRSSLTSAQIIHAFYDKCSVNFICFQIDLAIQYINFNSIALTLFKLW